MRRQTGDEVTPGDGGIIEVSDLRKVYGDPADGVWALNDFSISIREGTVFGLLGPNGAGKTTAIKSMLGLVTPTAGEISICGFDPHARPKAVHRNVGAMLEGSRNIYWRLTVRENVEFFSRIRGREPADIRDEHERLLQHLSLAEVADEQVNNLSRGMKQKVSLACALSTDAPVLFLDEPTLGLDVEATIHLTEEIHRLSAEESKTIVLSSHNLEVISDVCDRIAIMKDGTVVENSPVDELVSVFDSRTYRIHLPDAPPALRDSMERAAEGFEWLSEADPAIVELTVRDTESLHAVLGAVVRHDREVLSIASQTPDLEDVFLSTISEER